MNQRLFIICIIAIIVLGFVVRIAHLEQIPPGFWLDEASHGVDAMAMQEGRGHLIFFPGNCGHEPMFTYIIDGSIHLMGNTITALRLPAGLIGGLTVLVFAFFVHAAFGNHLLTLMATGFLALNRWHIQFSRYGLRGILTPLFAVLVAYLVVRCVEKPLWSRFLIFSLALGASFYTYLSARMIPVIACVTFILYWYYSKITLKVLLTRLTAALAVTLVLMAPLIVYYLTHLNTLTSRTQMISIFSLPGNMWTHILDNIWIYLKMLQFHGDNVLRHNIPGQPMLNIVAAILFGIGLLVILWKRSPEGLSAVFTILIFMIPGILSTRGPASLRVLPIAPFACLISAIPILLIKNWKTAIALPVVLVLILISGSIDIYDYAVVWNKKMLDLSIEDDCVFGQNLGEIELAEWLNTFHAENPQSQILLSPQLYYHATVMYMMFRRTPVQVADLGDLKIDSDTDTIIGLNLIPRNAWWMRDSPDKAFAIWWTQMFGTSYNDIQALKRRNYPNNTNFMKETDRFLLDEILRLHPEARLMEFSRFAICIIPRRVQEPHIPKPEVVL